MSMVLSETSHEALQAGPGYELPVGLVEKSAELATGANFIIEQYAQLQLIRDEYVAAEAEIKDRKSPPVFGRQVLEDIEALGRITAEEKKILLENADFIADVMSRTEDNGRNGLTELMSTYSWAAQQNDRHLVRTAVGSKTERVVSQTILEIVNRGEALLPVTSIRPPVVSLKDRNERRLQDEAAGNPVEWSEEADDRASVSILRALLAIDAASFVASIPENMIRDTEHSRESYLTVATAALHDTLQGEREHRPSPGYVVAALFDGGVDLKNFRSKITGKIKKEYKAVIERSDEILRMGKAVDLFEAEQDFVIAKRLESIIGGAESQRQSAAEQRKTLFATVREISAESIRFVRETPSQERMLGALVTEAWLEKVMFGLTAIGGAKNVRDVERKWRQLDLSQRLPLHAAIIEHEARERAEKTAEIRERCSATLESLDQKYTIGSKLLRGLPGGLELRKLLTDLQDVSTRKSLMTHEAANQLSGLALLLQHKPQDSRLTDLGADLQAGRNAWLELDAVRSNGQPQRSVLLSSIDMLMELYESADMLDLTEGQDGQFSSLWELARFLQPQPTETNPEEVELPVPIETPEETVEPPADDPTQYIDIIREFKHIEFLHAFPPGVSATDIIEDLKARGVGEGPWPIEWERIHSLVSLREQLNEAGLDVVTHRLMQSTWHPLPHYVLEVTLPEDGARKVAIVESPIYGNATYVIADPDWREVVKETKEDARTLGATAKVHASGGTAKDHRDKLFHATIGRL